MKTRAVLWFLGICLAIGLVLNAREYLGGAGDRQPAAYRACQKFIEAGLRSPGSAKHPAYTDEAVSDQDPIYVVTSMVDSQNGFGALLRTHYRCEVRREGDGFRLVDLTTK